MFRRSASLLDFIPRDGELVEVRGGLGVYEPRGDLQLIVESMSRAGQGALFEQFLQLKAKLETEGLFDTARKRGLPAMPRAIGVVTSLGAAALHDVITALRRRVPHIPVIVSPAPVQGAGAPAELVRAMQRLWAWRESAANGAAIDVILLVRGGGSIEDLWAFNDELLARAIVQSPVPVISGVGHETDFSIADFCADLRAPTPTAAAELVAQPQAVWLGALELAQGRLFDAVTSQIDVQNQRVDHAASRLSRPSAMLARQQMRLGQQAHHLRHAMASVGLDKGHQLQSMTARFARGVDACLGRNRQRQERAEMQLVLLDPRLVLKRGYALLSDAEGHPVVSVAQTALGQALRATLADGEVDLTVSQGA